MNTVYEELSFLNLAVKHNRFFFSELIPSKGGHEENVTAMKKNSWQINEQESPLQLETCQRSDKKIVVGQTVPVFQTNPKVVSMIRAPHSRELAHWFCQVGNKPISQYLIRFVCFRCCKLKEKKRNNRQICVLDALPSHKI